MTARAMPDTAARLAVSARAISVRLGRTQVLDGVDLYVRAGCWLAVVGPNGAGKSTLLKCLAGLLPCTGTVSLLGTPLARLPARQRARRLAWLGQNEAAADDLTAWDVAMLGRLPHQGWLAAPAAADHAAVARALRATQAWEWRARPLGQLSGGERQRVLLARALATESPVLLMDEPLANLDPPHQADWMALARGLARAGRTVISVLHELNAALAADELAVMRAGRITCHGPAGDAATWRALEAVFDHRIAVRELPGPGGGAQRIALPLA